MIGLKNATKAFKKNQLFHNVTVAFQPHEVTVLLGGNGVGKTTLLHVLAGIEGLNEGAVVENDAELTTKLLQQKIGFVPQEIALWEHLSVEENIRFFKNLKKNAIDEQQILSYCALLQLNEMKRPVEQLSGGTKRKANLLIGLLHRPEVLILDEPTVGIDLKSRYEIHRLVNHLKKQCTIIMTTHHLDEVEAVADRIVLLGKDPFYKNILQEAMISFEDLSS
ncbi:MAG: ABC transporter ATP-binding protein [Kurthia sp.]|nr:ABC transporter ATP-binding protein [Candidatus Kurthia equi]